MSGIGHEVIIARSAEDRQKCLDIRSEVFYKEHKFPAGVDIDEYDKADQATHFLLRLTPSSTPIGTMRCAKIAPFTYKLTRFAVLKNDRKKGLGRFLVLALHDWVEQQARMELIDNTGHRNINPTNYASDSEQGYMNTSTSTSSNYAVARTNTDDHPDEDPKSRSMSSNIRDELLVPPSTKIIADSRIPAVGFYARFGYQPEGEQFEDGELHQKMVLQLPLGQVLHVK